MIAKTFNSEIVLVITTFDNKENATLVSETILNKRLAACVNCREVNSKYWWDEKLISSIELELLIKTNFASLDDLKQTIIHLHDYERPELIYWKASSNNSYCAWIDEVCRKEI